MTHPSLPRAITLALALAAASLGPLFLSGTAVAGSGAKGGEAASPVEKSDATAGDKTAKPAGKGKAKPKKKSAAKAHAKAKKGHAKAGKGAAKPAKTKRASRNSKASPKRAKPTPKADESPKAGASKPQAACAGASVSLDRGGVEEDRFPLVDCHGKPLASAVTKVSVLARPWGAQKRASSSPRVDEGLLTRLAAIAKKLPNRTISLVGGARSEAGGTSAHHAGRAVDLQVEGVDNKKLVEICRTLADTGCGYYPNASFVHMDVRAKGTGKTSWIDISEPGEPPRYVPSWPPKAEAVKALAPVEGKQ